MALTPDEIDGLRELILAVYGPVTEELLRDLPRECVLLELASQSGFDREAAEARGLKCIAAPGLPGKAAPETAARAIKLTLEKIWEEEA